jgi:hypothetical protein
VKLVGRVLGGGVAARFPRRTSLQWLLRNPGHTSRNVKRDSLLVLLLVLAADAVSGAIAGQVISLPKRSGPNLTRALVSPWPSHIPVFRYQMSAAT